jgi:thymidylate synthase (FAD)
MMEIQTTSEITVRLIQSCGGDHMVVAAARVSTSGEEALRYADPACAADNAGLIEYLVKMRHGTPFEHSFLSFFVHAPIFVWREWHRHRIGFSYNEESARYKQLDPVFYIPPRDRPMMKVDGWKPGRPRFLLCDDDGEYEALVERLVVSYRIAYEAYQTNLQAGFDPGLARDCLPVGIYSSCWVSCNPRSLMAFLSLRTHDPEARHVSYPLHEIDVAARVAERFFHEGWPITHAAFVKHGRVAP